MRGGAVVARVAHNHEVTGSNPVPATNTQRGSGRRRGGQPRTTKKGPSGPTAATKPTKEELVLKRSIVLITAAAAMIGFSAMLATADNLFAEEAGPVAFEISAVADMDIADLAFVSELRLVEIPAWLEEEGATVRRVAVRPFLSPAASISTAKLQPELWRWPKRA